MSLLYYSSNNLRLLICSGENDVEEVTTQLSDQVISAGEPIDIAVSLQHDETGIHNIVLWVDGEFHSAVVESSTASSWLRNQDPSGSFKVSSSNMCGPLSNSLIKATIDSTVALHICTGCIYFKKPVTAGLKLAPYIHSIQHS